MSRLPRPHIPLAVRVQVAERQIRKRGAWERRTDFDGAYLAIMLESLFGTRKVELHHRPALVNRQRKRNGDYDPPANDPAHLVYLAKDDHDVETRVRGLRGAHSDLGMNRKNKAITRNRDPRHQKAKIRSASRWPPKGSRKIQNRKRR